MRDMAKQSQHIFVVSESSKFERVGLVNLITTQDVYCVVTDQHIPQSSQDYLEKLGVLVKLV